MNIQTHTLGKTQITRSYPWGLNSRNGHSALCSDGVIRAVELAECADTFFSTPARCRVKGKWLSGYVTVDGRDGLSSATDLSCYTFHQHVNGKHADLLPEWPTTENSACLSIMDKFKDARARLNFILEKAF